MTNAVTASRFQFPGFNVTANEDTSTHQVEVGTIIEGGHTFVLTLIRSLKVAEKGFSFLVSSVADKEGVRIWDFRLEGFDGVGMLAKAGNDTVIALLGHSLSGKVERVIPLTTLQGADMPDLRRMIEMKKVVAKSLGRHYLLTEVEAKVERHDDKRRRDERAAAEQAERAAQAAEHEARLAARAERVKKIRSRPLVTGFTVDAKRRQGIPVLESEWSSLPNGTFVILVESFDETTGAIGKLIESFQVAKERGANPSKAFAAVVSALPFAGNSATSAGEPVKPIGSTIVEVGKEVREVLLFRTVDEIKAARAAGLNGGSYVAVEKPAGQPLEVFSVRKDGMTTVGNFLPLA